jgi:hypothetical protein
MERNGRLFLIVEGPGLAMVQSQRHMGPVNHVKIHMSCGQQESPQIAEVMHEITS